MRKLALLIAFILMTITLFACGGNTKGELKTFTLEQLSAYDGQGGAKAYIAVNGIVYDVTNADGWNNGSHQGMLLAGTDATAVFATSPHSQSTLDELPKVGTLVSTTAAMDTYTPTTYLKVFTLSELSTFTGANGTTAYIAVNGVIYDVTNIFSNGKHQGMQLGGTDATTVFASSPHSQSLLNTLPIVGTLEGAPLLPITDSTGGSNTGDDDDYDDDDDYEDYENDEHVSYANLPEAIKQYIEANYPSLTIEEIEFEHGKYEIEFTNDTELKFDSNGQFLSVEYDN